MQHKSCRMIVSLSALLLLTSCGKKERLISESDLYGRWFTDAEYTYQSICFQEDGTYISENFYGPGQYAIYQDNTTKVTQITLVAENNDVIRLYPQLVNDEWVLNLENCEAKIPFTQNYREAPSDLDSITMTGSKQETDAILSSAITTILEADTWSDADGNTLTFSSGTYQYNDALPVSYGMQNLASSDSGFSCAFTSENTISSLTITEIYEPYGGFPIGYKLAVDLDSAKPFTGIHYTIPEYWPT